MLEEIRAILEIVASTKSDIVDAKEKRVALVKLYNPGDLEQYDRSLSETEVALTELEKFVEPARLDLHHNNGKIRAKTRLMWATKDSKSLSATGHRLKLARSRLSFVIMMISMRRDHDLRESPSLSSGEVTPSLSANRKGTFGEAVGNLRRVDTERFIRPKSLKSEEEETFRMQHIPRSSTTIAPTTSFENEDFDDILHRYEQTQPRPPIEPLGPSLTSMEALGRKIDSTTRLELSPLRPSNFLIPARRTKPDPPASILSTNQTPAIQTNDMRRWQQDTTSARVVPPYSWSQKGSSSSFLSKSDLGATGEARSRIFSSTTLDRLPTVLETSSVRFELDATEEMETPKPVEPVHITPQTVPLMGYVRPVKWNVATWPKPPTQAIRGPPLPYPDHHTPYTGSSNQSKLLPASKTMAATQASNRSSTGLRSTPHYFAGYSQPVDIRWLPEPNDPSGDKSINQPKPTQALMDKPGNSAFEFMYQPYRPPVR